MASFDLASPTSSSNIPSNQPSYPASESDRYDEDDDPSTLPYPRELERSDFLSSNFDPQTYLSTLRNRHQTLTDLRSDLRQRSQLLNRELLDLVNGNYEEFLSLGSDLRGGEEMVEGVRVGVLGFKREVEGIKEKVSEREKEVGELLEEKKDIRKDVMLGRGLLEVEAEIGLLEGRLGIVEKEAQDDEEEDDADEDDDDEDDDEDDETIASASIVALKQVKRLQGLCDRYVLITRRVARLGAELPFFVGQRPRVTEIRKTLLLDLATALREAKTTKEPNVVLPLLRLYGDLDAETEGVKVLKAA
ncbi:hypothetical protein K431DRAFT_122709 [Polychaeton citri CBS 116435]|uniref:Conserved oligomeric Golgi complex subunit 2 n=1 Tax=Polychaeton citri CBS 116435 TaxID=1314669 RepID=A0A9P4Q6J5_9PEZI|nr:hypothetical protein K431DRAFT_122709 [Polychaeton citri CBS 116435]